MMRLLLAFVAVSLVSCQSCIPADAPEGGIVLVPGQDLSHLPSYKNYYICASQSSSPPDDSRGETIDFNITHGTWRLRDSMVFVDQLVMINVIYPAKVDFKNSFFDSLDRRQEDDTNWRGLRLFGNPHFATGQDGRIAGEPDDNRRRTPSVPYGDCGSLDNVGFDNVSDDDECECNTAALSLYGCTGRTSVNSIRFFRGFHLLKLVNVTGLVATDVIATHRPDDSAQAGVILSHSQAAFIRIFMNHEDDCFEARDASSVTLCYPWFEDGNRTDGEGDLDNKIVVGEGSAVAIAGPNNIYADLNAVLSFEGDGGVIYYMTKCPTQFASGYDPKYWTSFYTGVQAPTLDG